MKNFFFTFFLSLIGIFSFGQTNYEYNLTEFDSLLHEEIYSVDVAEFQRLELIKFKNETYEGNLTHSVWKTNKKEEQTSIISQRIKIPEKLVEKLITKLKNSGYHKLKDCSEIKNCIKGLDGTTIIFNLFQKELNQSASFWELKSDYYYKTDSVEIPNEVMDARKILKIINNEIDLEKQFQNFISRLPVGIYMFNGIILDKK
ncbi:hypothetical protein [Flavobacterium piscinae]|uniref:hypothetical protein n=1 Tax=Flavobacterium piscinae TaxID=2506424 RepID=UPI001011ACDC|nr:hypothetical protein [Flavobacterium piscinae]